MAELTELVKAIGEIVIAVQQKQPPAPANKLHAWTYGSCNSSCAHAIGTFHVSHCRLCGKLASERAVPNERCPYFA